MKKLCCLLILISLAFQTVFAKPRLNQKPSTFKILTFNLWVGGDGSGFDKPKSVFAQLKTIRETKADIVAFQEQTSHKFGTSSRAKELADSLSWNCIIIDNSRAVISKFPLSRLTNEHSQLLKITVEGKEFIVADVHYAAYPYQPYDIADGKIKNEQEAIQAAESARGKQVASILEERKGFESLPMIVLGDFNEPSYFDWSVKAIKERKDERLTFAVQWPSSYLLVKAGFYDVYRKKFKQVKKKPAYTWTTIPGGSIPNEVHDRIDLIFASKEFKTINCWIVGEEHDISDIQILPWPTDHRAVLAEFEL